MARHRTDVTIPEHDGEPLFQPPPAGTLLVATLLFSAGLIVLGRLGFWGAALPRWAFVAGTWTLVAVFLGRVVGDFRWFGVFKRMREQRSPGGTHGSSCRSVFCSFLDAWLWP
jgi:hypothetical protein